LRAAILSDGAMTPAAQPLPGLQYYRAFAAGIVVLFHSAGVFGPTGYYPARSWEAALLFGHAGVELFFVLSGFIICYVHWDRIGRRGEPVSYIKKRLIRIYPPVFITVAAWGAFRCAANDPMRPAEWLDSLTLYSFSFSFAPPVLWTLAFEVAFYALFLLAFVSKRLFLVALAAWGVAGYVLVEVIGIASHPRIPGLIGSSYTFLFGMGAIAFFLVRKLPPLTARTRTCGGALALILFAIAAWLDVHVWLESELQPAQFAFRSYLLTPLFGLAGLIAVVLLADPRSRLTGWPHRILYFMGNASYAVYLWHLLPQRVIAHGLGRFGLTGVDMRPVAIAILVAAGLLTGAIFYRFIERPMLDRLNSVLLPRRRAPVPAGD
jgi:exopolysaccharide production protein ExoZ